MIFELFALTGVLAWFILGLGGLLIVGSALGESPGWASFWIALLALVVFGFTDFSYLALNLGVWEILAGLAGYLVVGATFALGRWFLLVKSIRAALSTLKLEEPEESFDRNAPRLLARQFRADDRHISLPPKASEFKSRVNTWLFFWPVNLISWAFEDLIIDLIAFISNLVRQGLDGVTALAWGPEND